MADNIDNRISVYDPHGNFVEAFGFDVIPGGATGFEHCTAVTTCQAGIPGTAPGQLDEPYRLATDCRGAIYVADTTGRVQRFGEPGTSTDPCRFEVERIKRNKRKGTARITVEVPGREPWRSTARRSSAQRPAPTDRGTLP